MMSDSKTTATDRFGPATEIDPETICETCAGSGEISTDQWDATNERHYTEETRCSNCDGTGGVER